MEASVTLKSVFQNFVGATGPDMDGKTFAKVAKDCGLLDKKLTATDIDLIFAKIKDKSARKITYLQFEKGVAEMATKKGVTAADVTGAIVAHGGPTFTGTKADAVKFHDDKTLWTGVYAKGGPTNVDAGRGGQVSDISQTCNRGQADVRGVVKK
jgi:p25-alpha